MSLDVAGIFVGGASERMGGGPKGLLVLPDGQTIVSRLLHLLEAEGLRAVLVGAHAAYASLGRPMIEDAPPGIGPLGGLAALLAHAPAGARVLTVACDMPFVSRALVARLRAWPLRAAAVAPRRDGRWEPMLACYDRDRALPIVSARIAAGAHRMHELLDALGAEALPLDAEDAPALRDVDTPADVRSLLR